ncbi:MAG: cellulase family glycosylhydrolase, partial [Eggerthellaceae bacterium]|nr:cellulase family glycosylhydrolase [Eggerthellaceae bacterium]
CNWAYEKGYITGYADGSNNFGVGDEITREQTAVILNRYAAANGLDLSTASGALFSYPDCSLTSDWAAPEMSWAVTKGIITGAWHDDDSWLEPSSDILREQIAKMLFVYSGLPEGNGSTVATPSVNGALQVSGSQLVDQYGNMVQLQGVSTHGIAWYPEYVNNDCFTTLHSWGVSAIRLAMYTSEYNGYCNGGDQEYLKNLVRNGVNYATNNDMYAIIDWHILSDGNPWTYADEAKSFFSQMSSEFAGNNNVIYEICNEPNGSTTWSDIKSYAETIIPIIRANDPDAIIIVGTPTWSQELDKAVADPITGYGNIMYSLHYYAATHKDSLRNTLQYAAEASLPIYVSEFGICDSSGNGAIDTDSADTWISLLNKYGISYTIWNLSNKDESSSLINSSVSKTSGFVRSDLSASGQWYYDLLTNGVPLEDNDSGSSSGNGESSSSGDSSSNNGTSVEITNGDLNMTLTQVNSWQQGNDYFYQYTLTLTNTSGQACSSWNVDIDFSEGFSLSGSWNGNFSINGNTLNITNANYNGSMENGASVTDIGFIIYGSSSLGPAAG